VLAQGADLELEGAESITVNENSFTHIMILQGKGELISENTTHTAEMGNSFFVTAGSEWQIKGNCSILYTVV
jgi:mannose-6-phosphate isomerase class I